MLVYRDLGVLFFFVASLWGCKKSESSDLAGRAEKPLFNSSGMSEYFPLRSNSSHKVLDVKDRSTQKGAFLQQWSYANQDNQRWRMMAHADGTVSLQAENSGLCLDILDFKPDNGALVGQWTCNEKANQKWLVRKQGEGIELQSAWNEKCLDVLNVRKDNGAPIGVWTCKRSANQLWTFGGTREMKQLMKSMDGMSNILGAEPSKAGTYSQLIGTQTFSPAYHFTDEDPILESARAIAAMGSRMIKLKAIEGPVLDAVLAMPFDTYFLWWRSNSVWYDGFSAAEREAEYQATYAFAKKLLLANANKDRSFYLGHWEGDWYLLPDYNTGADAPQTAIAGMIAWLNTRQEAIEAARRDVPKSLAKIYQYTEVNRVRDAMNLGKRRLVNSVLPKVRVDFVSYSSYDVQQESQETIQATLDYIESQLQAQPQINGRRVFIGECGLSAQALQYNNGEHDRKNREILIKFLKSGVPYVLYWSMYNNEVKDGKQVGFWLIDDEAEKQALWYTLHGLYEAQNESLRTTTRLLETDVRALSIQWLEGSQR